MKIHKMCIRDSWYPPNGFRCRCMVRSLSKRQVEQMGLEVRQNPPRTVDYDTGEILMICLLYTSQGVG